MQASSRLHCFLEHGCPRTIDANVNVNADASGVSITPASRPSLSAQPKPAVANERPCGIQLLLTARQYWDCRRPDRSARTGADQRE